MIPVVFHEGVQWYGCTKLLNDTIEITPYIAPEFDFKIFLNWREVPSTEEAVVMIHGDHQLRQVEEIQYFLGKFDRSIVVNIGDENGFFPLDKLVAPGRKIWNQMPVPGRFDFARPIVLGYPPDARSFIGKYLGGKNKDWFFSGQISHLHRKLCAEQLKKLTNGLLIETQGFWQGLGRKEYYDEMAHAKIIPCPSGPVTPDTFRVWEALEFGCVPIVDASCPKQNFPPYFWERIFDGKPPFQLVHNWDCLPDLIDEQLKEWPENQMRLACWWQEYKSRAYNWIIEDFRELRRT